MENKTEQAEENGQQLEQDILTCTVELRGKVYTFYLRMISMLEDTQLRQRFSEIAVMEDPVKKAEANYRINVEALTQFAVKAPLLPYKAEQSPLAAVAVKELFEDFTPAKDWIAEFIVRDFQTQLVPKVSFL